MTKPSLHALPLRFPCSWFEDILFLNQTGGLLRSRRLWWSVSGGVAYLDLLYHSPTPTVVWIYSVVHLDVSKAIKRRYGIQRRRIFSKENLPRNMVQDVAELLGMMVEDHKRLQPNVKTYAILSRKYQTLVSSRVEPLQEEAELGHEIDYMARYIAEGGLTGELKRWVP